MNAFDGVTPRQREIAQVSPDAHTHWLAGQIDEVRDEVLVRVEGLSSALQENTEQVRQNTKEQVDTRQRFTWLALTIAITVLTTVLGAIIVGAVT